MGDKQTYLEQINKYYSRELGRFDLIHVGMTPDILVAFGSEKLPIVMQQSTLTKCIRMRTGSRSAHELPRNVIETLPEQIENPIFLIQDKSRNSIVLITDTKNKENNNILIAIRLNERKNDIAVNEIKSIYGKTNLKEYLVKHSNLAQLHVIDDKKAEILSRVLGLQLPMTLINFSHDINLPSKDKNINTKISIHDRLEQFQKEISIRDNIREQKDKGHQIEERLR